MVEVGFRGWSSLPRGVARPSPRRGLMPRYVVSETENRHGKALLHREDEESDACLSPRLWRIGAAISNQLPESNRV